MATATKSRVKEVSRGALTGRGPTVKDARADLELKIDTALAVSYTPRHYVYRGFVATCWREPDGWCYAVRPNGDFGSDGVIDPGCSHDVGDMRQCFDSAAFHIIQNGMDVEAVRTESDIPNFLTDAGRRSELISWARWQRAARFAQQGGDGPDGIDPTNHSAVHRWACDHYLEVRFA